MEVLFCHCILAWKCAFRKAQVNPTARDSFEKYSPCSVVDANLLNENINILRRNTEGLLVAKDEAGLEVTV